MVKDLNDVKVSYKSSISKNIVFIFTLCCNILQNVFCNTFIEILPLLLQKVFRELSVYLTCLQKLNKTEKLHLFLMFNGNMISRHWESHSSTCTTYTKIELHKPLDKFIKLHLITLNILCIAIDLYFFISNTNKFKGSIWINGVDKVKVQILPDSGW